MRRTLTPQELAKIAGLSLDEIENYRSRRLLDPDGDGSMDDFDVLRLRILMHYRGLGRSVDDIEKTIRDGSPAVLYADLLWNRDVEEVTAEEAAKQVGLPTDVLESLLRSIGLGATIPKDDVVFLQAVKDLVDGGIPLKMLLDVARVYGDTMRRLAQTEVKMIREYVTDTGRSSLLKDRKQSERLNAVQELIGPILDPLLLTIHRRHLLQASVQEAVADVEAAQRGADREALETTIVFVDLASFTALAQIHGDETAAEILDRFDVLVRELLGDHDGTLVKQIGDAFMLVFNEPGHAVRYAIALEATAAREPNFPALRWGIHYGRVLYRVGDYVGNTVNIAARIAAIAKANEILVTEPVAAAAKEAGLRVVPAGTQDLYGVEEAVPLWRIEVRERDLVDRDPVCGMAVGDNAVARLVHEGAEYAFCSPACLRRFLEDPDRYLNQDRTAKPEL